MEIAYWSVRLSSMRKGDGVNKLFILASYMFDFIRVHDNLVYDPNNNNPFVENQIELIFKN